MKLGIIFVFCAFLFVGCQQQETVPVSQGKVYPSATFLQYFGEPPLPQEGYAYAHVGFLPLAGKTGKVQPIPLFMFNENEHLDRILSQLFSENLQAASRSNVLLPYSQGIHLTHLDQAGDTLIVTLSEGGAAENVDRVGIERAIVESATQFEEISRVRILYDGEASGLEPFGGYQTQPESIMAVAPPTLLDVVGVWSAQTKTLEEVLINFDRPVSVDSFRLLDAAGTQIGGKYFISMFNMAVVVYPEAPEMITEGMTVNVAWEVTDNLGRSNTALDTMVLVRKEH